MADESADAGYNDYDGYDDYDGDYEDAIWEIGLDTVPNKNVQDHRFRERIALDEGKEDWALTAPTGGGIVPLEPDTEVVNNIVQHR